MDSHSTADWEQQVKETLQAWHQAVELGRAPLARLRVVEQQRRAQGYPEDAVGTARAVRDVLRRGLDALQVPGQSPPATDDDPAWFDRRWRPYNILTLRFLRGLSRGEIQQRIGLAEGGQYYRAQREALAMLATLLREWEGDPREESPPVALRYPGGAVGLSDPFYIERESDRDLRYEMARPGRTVTITGPRQVGKTSLLVRAVQAHDTRLVYLDLQTIRRETVDDQARFLETVAYLIADEAGVAPEVVERGWTGRLAPGRKLTRLLEREILPAGDRPLILALDEVDRLLPADYHADFFGLLRAWHNLRARSPRWESFTLLMSISTEPYLLIDDMRQSPFNVGLTLYLADFTPEDVRELNERYGSPMAPEEIPRLHRLLHGHPYLTRVAFYTLVRHDLTLADLLERAGDDDGPFGAHLRHQRRLVSAAPELRRALGQVLGEGRCNDEMARYRLLKAGLIRTDGDGVTARCELYRACFERSL